MNVMDIAPLPTSTPVRHSALQVVLVLGIVIVVLVLIGIVAVKERNNLADAWSAFEFAHAFPAGTLLLTASSTGAVLMKDTGIGFASELPAGVLSVEQAGGHTAEITVSPAGEYFLSVDKKVLVSTTTPIYDAAVSPDGFRATFSEISSASSAPAMPTTPGTAVRPQLWNTMIVYTKTGFEESLGAGFGMRFIDNMHVVRFNAAAVIETDLATNYETILFPHYFITIPTPIAQSPDGSLLAWHDAFTKHVLVYKVTPTTMTQVATFPDTLASLALSNTALYSLSTSTKETTIYAYALQTGAAAQAVVTLPASVPALQISLP